MGHRLARAWPLFFGRENLLCPVVLPIINPESCD